MKKGFSFRGWIVVAALVFSHVVYADAFSVRFSGSCGISEPIIEQDDPIRNQNRDGVCTANNSFSTEPAGSRSVSVGTNTSVNSVTFGAVANAESFDTNYTGSAISAHAQVSNGTIRDELTFANVSGSFDILFSLERILVNVQAGGVTSPNSNATLAFNFSAQRVGGSAAANADGGFHISSQEPDTASEINDSDDFIVTITPGASLNLYTSYGAISNAYSGPGVDVDQATAMGEFEWVIRGISDPNVIFRSTLGGDYGFSAQSANAVPAPAALILMVVAMVMSFVYRVSRSIFD